MTATLVQRRRGTEAQCLANTPAEGEIWVDLTNDSLRVGDGLRAGGFLMPNGFNIQQSKFTFATTGGTANAITLTLPLSPAAYAQPLNITFKASGTNTGTVTVNVNGLGAKTVKKIFAGAIVDIVAGDIVSGAIYEIVYDGVDFQLVNLSATGIVTVKQGDLSTSTGSFSAVPSTLSVGGGGLNIYRSSSVIGPAGEYGFSISTYVPSNTVSGWFFGRDGLADSSYLQKFMAWANAASTPGVTVYASQRYINSSPPFDLGNGEVGGFFFALVNSSGDIVSHYAADVPPWGYNGPTNICATHQCKATGKKFRTVTQDLTFEQVMDGLKPKAKLEEITHEIKNRDMALIPHPFGEIPEGHTVVMLDPMDEKIRRMIDYQNMGGSEEIIGAIQDGKIEIDNSKCKRCGPKGVSIHKMKYKFSKKF